MDVRIEENESIWKWDFVDILFPLHDAAALSGNFIQRALIQPSRHCPAA